MGPPWASATSLLAEANMKVVPRERPDTHPVDVHHVCNVCGATSEKTICDQCSERLRIEALSRKKHEEQGDAWSHWE